MDDNLKQELLFEKEQQRILDYAEPDKIYAPGKPVPNFPGYEITKDGRVWSDKRHKTPHYLAPIDLSNSDRQAVNLRKRGRTYRKLIHILLLETYTGPRPRGYNARFIDRDEFNLHADNLCWGPRDLKRLTPQERTKIYDIYYNGEEEVTQQYLADMYCVSQSAVARILRQEKIKRR